MNVVEATESTFDEIARNHSGLLIVDFMATWCGPCRALAPELEKAAAELGEAVKVVKVDIDNSPNLSARFGVQGIPNLTFLKNGEVLDVAVGAMPRTALVQRIKRNLA